MFLFHQSNHFETARGYMHYVFLVHRLFLRMNAFCVTVVHFCTNENKLLCFIVVVVLYRAESLIVVY